MSEPLASILINNHNYGRFLAEAIESALAQTWTNTEVIVVDDGSTDDSPDIIRRYGERIVPILKENAGQGSSINAAFAASRGQYVFLLDADDSLAPEKVERVIRILRKHPDAGWLFHPLRLRDARSGAVLNPMVPHEQFNRRIDFRSDIRRGRPPAFAPATSGLCFTNELLSRILPMPVAEGTSADRFLKPMALANAPGYYLCEVLAEQKIHGANAHTQSPKRTRVAAKSLVLVAGWLREREPQLRVLANKMFATGLGMYDSSGGIDIKYSDAVEAYLRQASFSERIVISARRFYHGRLKRERSPSDAAPAPVAPTTS